MRAKRATTTWQTQKTKRSERFSHPFILPRPFTMVKTRIACYFDIPRGDNTADYQNFVDVSGRACRSSW